MAKKVHIDETGRIVEVSMDEQVDHKSDLAVQIPVPLQRRDRTASQNVVVTADHELAVQVTVPPEAHNGLKRVPAEVAADAIERREAAAGDGDGHPETEESVDKSVAKVEASGEVEVVEEPTPVNDSE